MARNNFHKISTIMKYKSKALFFSTAVTFGLLTVQQANATINVVNLGTANPPATLGGYAMTEYDPGSIAGTTQAQIGAGWSAWGQGYTGNVYITPNNSLTILLPNLNAVDFYVEPDVFNVTVNITATDSSGASLTETIPPGLIDSQGWGFYDTTGGAQLTSITITADAAAGGFAVGEFGMNGVNPVPEPSTYAAGAMLLLPFGLQGIRRLRNRK
jgi:hypothetical protein